MRSVPVLALLVAALLLALAFDGSPVGETGDARAETTTSTIRWGPYTIPAASGGMPGMIHNQIFINVEKPCTDCYVTGVVPDMVYENGDPVNFSTGGMMHHMVLFNSVGSDATCDSGTLIGSLGERILASGNERTVTQLPEGYGYYIASGDNWNIVMHLMNMMPSPKTVYLEFTFDHRPGSDPVEPVTPVWLDVNNCGSSEYAVPAGYSDTTWDWVSTLEGNIVAIAGHVHNYGISIAAEHVDTGDYICTSVAGYADGSSWAPAPVTPGGAGHPGAANALVPGDPDYVGRIEDMTTCAPTTHIEAGETLRLHTQYNPPAPLDDVMGIMMAYLHETTEPLDYDGDGVPDDEDNCMAWYNPTQEMPPWPVPADDPDCDGYSTADEAIIGTYEMVPCAATPDPNDEEPDSWPADFDDNQVVNILDIVQVTPPVFGSTAGDPEYSLRKDLKPDGVINVLDVVKVTSPVFGANCS